MTYIVAYQKFINSDRTVEINLPVEEGTHSRIGDELATVEGITYVAIPDGIDLPEQPSEIDVEVVILEDHEKKLICSISPLVKVINDEVKNSIAEKYSTADEIKLLRTQPSPAFDEYNAFVESCRLIGKNKKQALGLI